MANGTVTYEKRDALAEIELNRPDSLNALDVPSWDALRDHLRTADADRGRDLATRIDCGTVAVNDAYVSTWGSTDAPMGGMKESGLGRRHGRDGISKYTETQTVAVQRGLRIGPGKLPERLWAKMMTGAVKLLGRLPRWLR